MPLHSNATALTWEKGPTIGYTVQPSLQVGAVNDPLEQEADAMADQIMRMPENGLVQRKCSECEEREKVQRRPMANFIQKKGTPGGTMASEGVSQKINASRGQGNAMAKPTQSFMESRFGADFSNINIHTGSEAAQMSQELGAKAFTVGNDIYFNQGQYNPDTNSGKHLLAHELTHTLQQGGGADIPATIQRDAPQEETETEQEDQIDPLLRRVVDGTATEEERQALINQLSQRSLTRAEEEYLRSRITAEVMAQLPNVMGPLGSSLTIDTNGTPGDRELCYQINATLYLSGSLAAVNGFEGELNTTARLISRAADRSLRLEIAVPTGDYRPAIMARNFVFPDGPLVFDLGESGYRGLGMLVSAPGFLNFDIIGQDGESSSSMVIQHPDVPSGARMNVTLVRDDDCSEIPDRPVNYLDTIPPWRAYVSGGIGGTSGDPIGAFSFGLDMPLVAADFGIDVNERELFTVPDLGYAGLGLRAAADTRGAVTLGGAAFVGLDLEPLRFQFGGTLGAEYLPEDIRGDLPEWNLRYGLEGIISYQVLEYLDILAIGSGEFGDGPTTGSFRLGIGVPFL